MRCEEIMAAHPDFSKMDEVLYLAGMSSYYLSEGKGSQKVNLNIESEKEKYNPEKLKADAIVYLKMLIDKYPKSSFRKEAAKTLEILEGKKESK
jgi:outer membrane protein assembly factor BamD (BamD/ComL family)